MDGGMQFLPQLGRDVTMIWRELRGRTPAPFQVRRGRRAGLATRKLRVVGRRPETAEAITLLLEDAAGAALTWRPGQFFTLLVRLEDGTTLRRAYSACRPCTGGELPLTVKRVAGGRASTFLHEGVREGDVLEALGPSGAFVAPASARTLVLVGGGSGITPLAAILHAALAEEQGPQVTLVYGNRRQEDIIFADELATLATRHPGRFTLLHVLGEGFDVSRVPTPADAEYFVCGPAGMMDAVADELRARGVPGERVHEERFTSPPTRAATSPQPLRILRAGRATQVTTAPGQTLLEAGLAAGVPMPYSCALGGCGACKVVLTGGSVVDDGGCLSAEERARGLVLACSARPSSPCTIDVPT
jgi:ring-1,2-phenylacetyl-CoA epoxidase subunit PaaE